MNVMMMMMYNHQTPSTIVHSPFPICVLQYAPPQLAGILSEVLEYFSHWMPFLTPQVI